MGSTPFFSFVAMLTASIFCFCGHPTAEASEFVGSETCKSCHETQFEEWKTSQHHAAMQEANDSTVLGDFNGAKFSKDGVESTFFKKNGAYWVRTDGPDGQMADFEIKYTFGVYPLQQYLIAMPGGRYQVLGIAWDARSKESGGQRWYHLYPDMPLKAGDPLHWTGINQNWNYQCAWCHSTNLQKNYSAQTKTFQTTWSEVSVGCEACHGPASKHISWAAQGGAAKDKGGADKGFDIRFDERAGVTWPMDAKGQAHRSQPRTSSKEIEVCATCHGRRQQFSSDAAAATRLFDGFRPSLLENGLYHADGQQHDEVFNYGSFAQSRMHVAGVTCSDCHNPHSGKVVAPGNAVCAQCHAPARFDDPKHHHHPASTAGAQCAACHMPVTTYMGVDGRHDHSMRIPRPDRTVMLGTPNACTACHKDKTAVWARDAVKAWYPSPKSGYQDFAEAFDLADRRGPGAQQGLIGIARGESGSGIARASALSRLGQFSSAEALELATTSLKIEDPLVRSAAISVIANADPATRRNLLVPLLRDPSRLVRMDAARALAGEVEKGIAETDRTAFDAALAEYIAGQMFNAERPETHLNLAGLYREQGKRAEAQAALQTAIELDPTFAPASVMLAEMARQQGNEADAEKVLRDAIKASPDSGALVHALGLSLVRQRRLDDDIRELERAVELAPEDARFAYVLAVALHDTGKPQRSIQVLKDALARQPYDRDMLMALASYEAEAGDFISASQRADLLAQLEPENPQIAQMAAALRQRVR